VHVVAALLVEQRLGLEGGGVGELDAVRLGLDGGGVVDSHGSPNSVHGGAVPESSLPPGTGWAAGT
jgi:hypothetical protein